MRATEWRERTDTELGEELDGLRRELFQLRFQKATRQLADTGRVAKVKKDIARVLTIQREREISAEYALLTGALDEVATGTSDGDAERAE